VTIVLRQVGDPLTQEDIDTLPDETPVQVKYGKSQPFKAVVRVSRWGTRFVVTDDMLRQERGGNYDGVQLPPKRFENGDRLGYVSAADPTMTNVWLGWGGCSPLKPELRDGEVAYFRAQSRL
jgi:hypothetical protein